MMKAAPGKIDLETKSNGLKAFVSRFATPMFLGDLTALMNFIRFDNPTQSLKGLSSPQRQLLYLMGLNLSTTPAPESTLQAQYTDPDLEEMKKMLLAIEEGYEHFFYPQPGQIMDAEWIAKRKVAMPTFLSFFNQGALSYEEQTEERVTEYFTPFTLKIEAHFGISVQDFIKMYDLIESIPNKFLMEKINKKPGQQTREEFFEEMQQKNIMPWEMQAHMPEHLQEFHKWMYDKGRMYRFSKDLLISSFGQFKTEAFLNALTCERKTTDFLYYTEKNIIHTQPIFNIGNDEFQTIGTSHLIQGIYNTLFDYCITNPDLKDRFYKLRGKKLEEKTIKVFQKFFGGKATIYKGFYTDAKHEQDLLIIFEDIALIIEAKASKRDEPKRDPDKAYPLILSNFEETVQKGYDQAYRVKSQFISKKPLNIFRDAQLKHLITTIKTANFHNVFSIIVTLDRFGQIQSDLSDLLEIYDNDEFPWSACIDDLEIFLLQLVKSGKRKADLSRFLNMRQQLHGKLITSDELEVCGAFLNGSLDLKKARKQAVITFSPTATDIFDLTYQTRALGFENERNLEQKTSGKYLTIGGI